MLEYETILNADGSIDVTELWGITLSDTNTLSKKLNSLSTNVQVSEVVSSSKEIPFVNTNMYQSSLNKGQFYALKTKNGFEIAWGVSVSDSRTKQYKISYHIEKAIFSYQDCSEFRWRFDIPLPVNIVKGTIKLPEPVQSMDNLKVTGSNVFSENFNITDNQTVSFFIRDLKPHQNLSVKLICQDNIFKENLNGVNTTMENFQNFPNNFLEKLFPLLKIFALTLCIIYFIFYTLKIVKYIKLLRQAKKNFTRASKSSLYFKDLPDETATPAEAGFLYYFNDVNAFNYNISKIISATILSLALKKAIKIKEYEENKVGIIIDTKYQKEKLKKDEQCIYNLLCEAKKTTSHDMLLTEYIEVYAKTHSTTFTNTIRTLKASVEIEQDKKKNFNRKILLEARKWKIKSRLFYLPYILIPFALLPNVAKLPIILGLIIPNLICSHLCIEISKYTKVLTQKGVDEREQWKGLKNYMNDFSLLNKEDLLCLSILERYLIYATAFGVADSIVDKLQIEYNDLSNSYHVENSTFSYSDILTANKLNHLLTLDWKYVRSSYVSINNFKVFDELEF